MPHVQARKKAYIFAAILLVTFGGAIALASAGYEGAGVLLGVVGFMVGLIGMNHHFRQFRKLLPSAKKSKDDDGSQ